MDPLQNAQPMLNPGGFVHWSMWWLKGFTAFVRKKQDQATFLQMISESMLLDPVLVETILIPFPMALQPFY